MRRNFIAFLEMWLLLSVFILALAGLLGIFAGLTVTVFCWWMDWC